MKGIDNTHLFNANMIATADLDKEVVVSYAAIHCGLTNEMIENYEDFPVTKKDFSGISEEDRLKIRNEIMRAEWEKSKKQ